MVKAEISLDGQALWGKPESEAAHDDCCYEVFGAGHDGFAAEQDTRVI